MFTQREFRLSEGDYRTIENWADTHECSIRHGDRASRSCCGGEISVTFTPTTIGTVISAQCACGQSTEINNL